MPQYMLTTRSLLLASRMRGNDYDIFSVVIKNCHRDKKSLSISDWAQQGLLMNTGNSWAWIGRYRKSTTGVNKSMIMLIRNGCPILTPASNKHQYRHFLIFEPLCVCMAVEGSCRLRGFLLLYVGLCVFLVLMCIRKDDWCIRKHRVK